MIGCPNASRVRAWSSAISSAPRAVPSAHAEMFSRASSSVTIASRKPSPSVPSSSPGVSSNRSSVAGTPRSPSRSSSRTTVMPSISPSTRNAEMPASVRAQTVNTSPTEPFVM